jgi:hypothetical protein
MMTIMQSAKPVCHNGIFKTSIQEFTKEIEDIYDYCGLEQDIVFSPHYEQLSLRNNFNTPTKNDKKEERERERERERETSGAWHHLMNA